MKRLLPALFITGLLPALLWAVSLLQFTGEVLDEQAVELRWSVDSVQGMTAFDVERSTDNEHFQLVGERIPVNGGLDYMLLDSPGLASLPGGGRDRMTDIEQIYYYRLYYVLPSGGRLAANQEALQVSFQLSTVSVTWGSIKAMFR